jgi:hypothetical protein
MKSLIQHWEENADRRAEFLRCYSMMTNNLLTAIHQKEFADSDWVDRLLDRFAEYYFVALEAYEQSPASAPPVWQFAHGAARDPGCSVLQLLLLGINAHINYDLALALGDILRPEWTGLTESQRAARYADHCRINHVIGRTIDAVQDQVVEPTMPLIRLFDYLLGPIDEMLTSRLIALWRETVWRDAKRLLETNQESERARMIEQFEAEALKIGEVIYLKGIPPWVSRRPIQSHTVPVSGQM